MPAATIIIPSFNRERFLGAAIDSALAQGEGLEIIVVDDGSTDGSSAVLARYGERIRVLRQANAGPSAARNFGAGEARGEYLFFLDSDDLAEPGAVQALLAEARRLGPGRVAFGRASTIGADDLPARGPVYGFPHLAPGHELGLSDLLGGVMPLWLTLMSRDRYRALGGLRADLRLGEDQEFAMRVHRSGVRFVATDVPAVRVRMHGGPRLSGGAMPGHGERLQQLWTIVAAEAPDLDAAARQALARVVWNAGRDAARIGERDPADALFALATSLDPGADRAAAWPLRVAGRLGSPYRAERLAELVKRGLGRS